MMDLITEWRAVHSSHQVIGLHNQRKGKEMILNQAGSYGEKRGN
jgi:hypothetical protein